MVQRKQKEIKNTSKYRILKQNHIMEIDLYYTEEGNIIIVSNNYDHSLKHIDLVLELAPTFGLTLPDRKDIEIRTLAGPRYKGMTSVEFKSVTKPNEGVGTLLTRKSGLWEWLKY